MLFVLIRKTIIPRGSLHGRRGQFAWNRWIAHRLQLSFSAYGASCTQNFLVACCNLLLALVLEIGPRWADRRKSIRLSNGGVEAMLGQCPWLRIERICEAVLLAIPSSPRMNVADAFSVVALIVEDVTKSLNCSCKIEMCRCGNGWEERESKEKFYDSKCPRRKLWDIVGTCLGYGLICF
jgi:hypothetical protein